MTGESQNCSCWLVKVRTVHADWWKSELFMLTGESQNCSCWLIVTVLQKARNRSDIVINAQNNCNRRFLKIGRNFTTMSLLRQSCAPWWGGQTSLSLSFAVHKFPDPWHWIKNCLEQWVQRVFRFYEQYIRKNSKARKRETTHCNTAKLNQPGPNT